MKQFFKSFLTFSMLLVPAISADCGGCETSCETSCESSCESSCETSCNTGCNNTCSTTSIFRPRSQGADTARELVGWQDWIHRYECGKYKTVALAFQYERSFNGNKIANTLFGTDTLNFVGSGVANRVNTGTAGCCNLVADYFGLPTLTNASLKLNPLIQNYIFDIEAYWGLETCGKIGRAHV